ncbi:MAG: HlyD family secretion protein [Flavisolibacter sp.]
MKIKNSCLPVHLICYALAAWIFTACGNGQKGSDASGTFEVDEVIVSSEVSGKILSLQVEEGSQLARDSVVGLIDSLPLVLQKSQVEATAGSLREKTMNVQPQVRLLKAQLSVQEAQLQNGLYEKARIERLIRSDAATTKQLDDLNTQIDVLRKQMGVTTQQIRVQENTTGTQNNAILSEYKPLRRSISQIEDQIKRTVIRNPVSGTVLTKYAMTGEVTTVGKALYKIGDLSLMTLRAYITGAQLSRVRLQEKVTVLVDNGASRYRTYEGQIYWISDKTEFTPKTIQTKDERANLVYAIKIRVKNDGYLKIGMYGECKFSQP